MPCEAFGSPNFAFMRHQCVRSATGADRGGSNGARMQRWKRKLQRFANEIGPAVTIANLPPGTSKGNRIEHRLLSVIGGRRGCLNRRNVADFAD